MTMANFEVRNALFILYYFYLNYYLYFIATPVSMVLGDKSFETKSGRYVFYSKSQVSSNYARHLTM